MELCCTTVMLPRWTLDETFDKLAAYAYDGVELRCRYNPAATDAPLSRAFWGPHRCDINPDNIVERAGDIRAACASSPWLPSAASGMTTICASCSPARWPLIPTFHR